LSGLLFVLNFRVLPSGHRYDAVKDTYGLALLENWDLGFKSRWRHGYVSASLCCAVLCR